jgi:hypothetical protein
MLAWIKGNRTKAIAAALALKALLAAFGFEIDIPAEVVDILIAAGLLTARAPGAEALAQVKS